MERPDDTELMLAYASGDARAFETLYARHRGPVFRYLNRQVRDRETASELFQETWMRVVAARARYEPRARFQTFLYRIARNCCIDHARRAALRPSVAGLDIDENIFSTSLESDPAHAIERTEATQHYRQALDALPAEQRDVFLLYEESGLSLEDIAQVTGIGTETSKSRLRYAVAKLHALLKSSYAQDAPEVSRL